MITHKLFTEKFRPTDLEEIVLPNRIKDLVTQGLKQNLLLHSGAGRGKTSLARILTKSYATLYINASEETSVDVVRNEITDWCTTASLFDDDNSIKAIILDECLLETESVRIGEVNNWKPVPLKDLVIGTVYNCVSMNIETGKLENDTCEIISQREAELFEVELEDGRMITVTENHPFMVNELGSICEKSLIDGLSINDEIIVFDE